MEMIITSKDNKIYKQTKALLTAKGREKHGLFIAEGERLAREAAASDMACYVCVSDSYAAESARLSFFADLPINQLSDRLFETISATEHTQGVLCVCKLPQSAFSANDISLLNYALVLDGISDPGNMGTLLRTAEAAGADCVLLTSGCVDVYSPKVVRATMGAIFRLPIYSITKADALSLSLPVYVTALNERAVSLFKAGKPKRAALVIGSEARGVSEFWNEAANAIYLRIPMKGKGESLNAAVAGAIAMYAIFGIGNNE